MFVPDRCGPPEAADADQVEPVGCTVVVVVVVVVAAAADADMCDKKCGCGVTGEFIPPAVMICAKLKTFARHEVHLLRPSKRDGLDVLFEEDALVEKGKEINWTSNESNVRAVVKVRLMMGQGELRKRK